MRDSGPLLIVRPPKDRTPHVCGSVEPSLAQSCRASHMVCRGREVSDIPQESRTAAWPIRNVLPGRDFRLMERSSRLP